MTYVAPLHPATREFLTDLYAYRAVHLQKEGVPPDKARAEADALGMSFRDAFLPGPEGEPPMLVHLEPNVICREIEAGLVPEEFADGPIFHPAVTPDVTAAPAGEEAA